MTGRVSGYAPRNRFAIDFCRFRASRDFFVGTGFAFPARYEIAPGLNRAVGVRAVGAWLRRWWRRWNADDTVSHRRIAVSLERITGSAANTSGNDGQHHWLVRERCVQSQPGPGPERRVDSVDELDGQPSRARDERRNTYRNACARSDRDDDRWHRRELPMHDASQHGRQHQRIIGDTPSGRRQRRRRVPDSGTLSTVIRFRLVAAAVLLFVPAMARAQPQESAPPPATVDPRDLASRRPSLVEPDLPSGGDLSHQQQDHPVLRAVRRNAAIGVSALHARRRGRASRDSIISIAETS